MTTLEIVLIIIIWVIVGCFLAHKQDQISDTKLNPEIWVPYMMFAPIVLIGAIVRQLIIEEWR